MENTGQAQEKAKEVAGQAQERAQEAAHQAKGRLRDQVDQRSTQAGQQINTMADDVRSVAEELRGQGKETPAKYAEQAAERAQRAGQWLEQADGDRILRDVENFARRNPWAVAAGGLVLGLAASRLLKASSTERYRASVSDGGGSTPYSAGTSYGGSTVQGGTGSLAAEPMPSGASTEGARFTRDEDSVDLDHEGSLISTEPRT